MCDMCGAPIASVRRFVPHTCDDLFRRMRPHFPHMSHMFFLRVAWAAFPSVRQFSMVGAALLAAATEGPAQRRCHRCTTILGPGDEGGEVCDACAAELADEALQEWTREARSDEEVEAAPAEGGQE